LRSGLTFGKTLGTFFNGAGSPCGLTLLGDREGG